MSDALTGILTAFVSLAALVQFAALLLVRRVPVKRWVTTLQICNQAAFTALYFIPLAGVPGRAGIFIFSALLLSGQVIARLINSAKIGWFMGLVPDKKRGVFTANKEMISLAAGMIFSFVMSRVIDTAEAAGDLPRAFLVMGVTIAVLAVLHTATLLFSREKPVPQEQIPRSSVRSLVRNRRYLSAVGIYVLWNIASGMTTPFYGTYTIKELGFSLTFLSVLTIGYALVRIAFSRTMGRIADKHSFSVMLLLAFGVHGAAFLINTFTAPQNGRYLYTAYYLVSAVAMAGINSGSINLIYDSVPLAERTGALAVSGAISGVIGFLASLAGSAVVRQIQARGNRLFGHTVYAQQLLSAVSAVIVSGILLYIYWMQVRPQRRPPGDTPRE